MVPRLKKAYGESLPVPSIRVVYRGTASTGSTRAPTNPKCQLDHPRICLVGSGLLSECQHSWKIFFDLIHHIRNSPWLHRDDPIAPSYVRTRVVSLLIDMEHSKLQLDCTAACTVRCIACRLNNLLPHLSCEIKVFKLSSLLVRLRIASLSHAALPWGPALEAPGRYRYRAGLFRVCARVDQECVQSVNTYIIFQAGFSL
jgi:hypothetical protein